MNNLETRFTVVGTAALKAPEQELCQNEQCIIEFPGNYEDKPYGKHAKADTRGYVHAATKKILNTELMGDLRFGSIAGKPFNKVTPLQSGLIGCGMFALAMTCAFFGV